MAKSTDSKVPELIARRDRPFTLYYYHALGENDAGEKIYKQEIVTRCQSQIRRANGRSLEGNQSANQVYIVIELRDCNVRDFIASKYERDFCILCAAQDSAPADNLTPESAINSGYNPLTINAIEPIFNAAGKKIQIKIQTN